MFRDNDSALDQVATGQVFTANQALEAGLIDRIGFIEEAVGRAVELASLSPDNVRVVEYHSKATSVAELLMGGQASEGGFRGLSLQQMLDLTAPRAYYLSTWLPAVLSNTRP
jgi:protease-4